MQASVRDQLDSIVDVAAWVGAADELCRVITSGDLVDPYPTVVERVRELADADLVTLVRPGPDGSTVSVVAAAGHEARHWRGKTVPAEGTVAGTVLRTGEPRLLLDVTEHLGENVRPITGVTGLLVVPLRDAGKVSAVLTVGRAAERTPFVDTDLALVGLFAGQLALALSHRDEQARLERAVLTAERDRIARGMQSRVIAPLFALGMRLQSTAAQLDAPAAGHLAAGSDEIDETLKAIRATVYRLAD